MHKTSSLLLLVLATASSHALAVTAEQKITAVTVYPDRALVTRSGQVKLDAGIQSVVFDNLPLNLEEDSVRAKGSSQGNLKILGVEVRHDYKEAAVSTTTKQLQDDLTKLDDQIRALNDEQSDLSRRNDFLDKLRDKVTAQTNGSDGKDTTPSVTNIQGLFDLYGMETSKITTRKREIEFTLRDLNKQRDDKANQLSLLQQPAAPNTRSAVVTVEAGEAGSANLQVSYLIAGAGWQPQYDAYADPEAKKVELTYYGVVRQITGENWDDVTLKLSTSRPSTAARLPELGTWTVDFNAPVELAAREEAKDLKMPMLNKVQAAQANQSADAAAPTSVSQQSAAPAALQVAEVQSLGPAATFTVPAKTSIPNDNQPHRSAISVQTLKGDWTYVATPKLVSSAFLKTKVTNTSDGPLLGGEINAFLANNFIGKSNIGLVAANASFDLFLGTDENIKVTRTEGVKKEDVGGILSKQKVYRRSFSIEVQNFKSTEISLKLIDQLPVSKNSQIVVNVNKVTPDFSSHNEDTGEVNWELKLQPNEKKSFTVEYEVDAPYDQPVAGI